MPGAGAGRRAGAGWKVTTARTRDGAEAPSLVPRMRSRAPLRTEHRQAELGRCRLLGGLDESLTVIVTE